MITPTSIEVEGASTLAGKPGDTFPLTARLLPENVTLPQIFWRSTNPEVATVDANGLVTLHADIQTLATKMAEGDETVSCEIIAESLYSNGPVAEFSILNDRTEIKEIQFERLCDNLDFESSVSVYDLNGRLVADKIKGLGSGLYILRQGEKTKKIIIK